MHMFDVGSINCFCQRSAASIPGSSEMGEDAYDLPARYAVCPGSLGGKRIDTKLSLRLSSLNDRDRRFALFPMADDQLHGFAIHQLFSVKLRQFVVGGFAPRPVRVVVAKTGKSVSQIALNWLLQRPTVSDPHHRCTQRRPVARQPRRNWLEAHDGTNRQTGCRQRHAPHLSVLAPTRVCRKKSAAGLDCGAAFASQAIRRAAEFHGFRSFLMRAIFVSISTLPQTGRRISQRVSKLHRPQFETGLAAFFFRANPSSSQVTGVETVG